MSFNVKEKKIFKILKTTLRIFKDIEKRILRIGLHQSMQSFINVFPISLIVDSDLKFLFPFFLVLVQEVYLSILSSTDKQV